MAVYFVKCAATGLIKIGYTTGDARKRVKVMQTGSPGALVLLGVIPGSAETEASLHERFADLRRRGEWFECIGELAALVAPLSVPAQPPRKGSTRHFWNGQSAAEVARATGIPRVTLSAITRGRHRPSPAIAVRLQNATGVSAIKLVFGDLASEAR